MVGYVTLIGLSEIEIKELVIIAHFWTMKIIRKRNSSNGKLFMLPPNKIERIAAVRAKMNLFIEIIKRPPSNLTTFSIYLSCHICDIQVSSFYHYKYQCVHRCGYSYH